MSSNRISSDETRNKTVLKTVSRVSIGNLCWAIHPLKKRYWPCRIFRRRSRLQLYFLLFYLSDETGMNDEWFWIPKKHIRAFEELKLIYFKENERKLVLKAMKAAQHEFKKDAPDDSFVNEDICFQCRKGGLLMICDNCPNTFHTVCAGLPNNFIPSGKWFCPKCKKKKKKKKI